MKDLEKVQKTLINVFNYLKYKTDTEVSKSLLTELGDAHEIVENLAIHDVSCSSSLELKKELEKRGAVVILKEDREVGNYS